MYWTSMGGRLDSLIRQPWILGHHCSVHVELCCSLTFVLPGIDCGDSLKTGRRIGRRNGRSTARRDWATSSNC